MQLYYSLDEWRVVRAGLPNHLSIGFVPTMGHLHAGHASLMAASLRENDLTVASIYVNRMQFNNREDFDLYPRTLESDLEMLKNNGVTHCLIPSEEDMYPDDFRYRLSEVKRSEMMEGRFRPDHFTGMLTIVMKLLQLVKPHRGYFGEKDYQQYSLIRDMVNAFFMDIEIVACPTIRESSGLPYSSRNTRLSEEARRLADEFARVFHQHQVSCEIIMQQLMALGIAVDYIEEHQQRRYAAVKVGGIRLIDNYSL